MMSRSFVTYWTCWTIRSFRITNETGWMTVKDGIEALVTIAVCMTMTFAIVLTRQITQLDAKALPDPPRGVGVAEEVTVDLERKRIDPDQGQAAVDRLPLAEQVVHDRGEVVGDHDLLGQAPEDQVRPLVELLEVELARL